MSKGGQITITSPAEAGGNGGKVGSPTGKHSGGRSVYDGCYKSDDCDTCDIGRVCVNCHKPPVKCCDCRVIARCILFEDQRKSC